MATPRSAAAFPIIFPQFAAEGPLPRHGFARTSTWSLGGVCRAADGAAEAAARAARQPCHARHLGGGVQGGRHRGRLRSADGDHPRRGERRRRRLLLHRCASHVPSRARRRRRRDRRSPRHALSRRRSHARRDDAERLRVDGFVDRVYVGAPSHLELHERGRRMLIDAEGFPDAVVWNPGRERAAALADLDPGGERHFVCIEAAAVQEPVTIGPRRRWTGTQTLTAWLTCRARVTLQPQHDERSRRPFVVREASTDCGRRRGAPPRARPRRGTLDRSRCGAHGR